MANSDAISKTLPYEPVNQICNETANHAQAISSICTEIMGEYNTVKDSRMWHRLYLVRTTCDVIAGMMDHILDGDMRGDMGEWLDLPDMKQEAGHG